MVSSSGTNSSCRATGIRPNQGEILQQQQQPVRYRCPRCDSTDTKFCYYNNYSLSQPRHFCKSCKRYWTRGGTLRNVPVGGGGRKNKRAKHHGQLQSTIAGSGAAQATSRWPSTLQPGMSSQLFYGLQPTGGSCAELNFPFSTRYDLEPVHNYGLGSPGLGFSSGILNGGAHDMSSKQTTHNLRATSNYSFLYNYNTYGSSSSSSSSTATYSILPSISTLLPSASPQIPHHQLRSMADDQGVLEMNWKGSGGLGGMFLREMKLENGQLEHGTGDHGSRNLEGDHETLVGSSSTADPALLGNGTCLLGPCSNLGSKPSSIPSP